MVKDFRAIDPRDARVILIEGAKDVLPVYVESLRKAARASLEKLGVSVITDTFVEEIGAGFVRTPGRTIRCGTTLWAAGVTASAFGQVLAGRIGAKLDRNGRVMVGPDCSLPGHPEIFVVGDLARLTDARGREVPGLAQGAIQQGRYVADLLRARERGRALKPFAYRNLGTMAVIGMNHAVGDLGFVKVTGVIGWFIWAFCTCDVAGRCGAAHARVHAVDLEIFHPARGRPADHSRTAVVSGRGRLAFARVNASVIAAKLSMIRSGFADLITWPSA